MQAIVSESIYIDIGGTNRQREEGDMMIMGSIARRGKKKKKKKKKSTYSGPNSPPIPPELPTSLSTT